MRYLEPDSPAAVRRYQALKRRWSRAGLAARVGAVALAIGSLGGIGAGTYLAATAVPRNVTIFSGPVAQVDTPFPSDTPTDAPTTAPTEAPTPAPTEAPVVAPAQTPIPINLPAPAATPVGAPAKIVLWSDTASGPVTTPTLHAPTGEGDFLWSYDCSAAPEGDFGIVAYDSTTNQRLGGLVGADQDVKAAGEGTFGSPDAYLRITTLAACEWTVTVRG